MSVKQQDSYYKKDKCLGGVLTMNGKNVYSEFNADVIEVSSSLDSLDINYERNVGKSSFDVYNKDFGEANLVVSFYVGGIDKNDALFNVNSLIVEASSCEIRFEEEDNYEFSCVLSSSDSEYTDVDFYYKVELSFKAIRHNGLVKSVSNGEVTEFQTDNLGVVSSGVSISVTSPTALEELTVYYKDVYNIDRSVKIEQLKEGMPFVIDGINGAVTENGINSFNRTDLVMFPKVFPRLNKFKSDKPVKWEITYYPTYVM